MAICVAEEAATGTLEPARVGDRFLEWIRSGPADVGIQTRAVLGRASKGADLPAIAAEHFRNNPMGAADNGSLMRTALWRSRTSVTTMPSPRQPWKYRRGRDWLGEGRLAPWRRDTHQRRQAWHYRRQEEDGYPTDRR
jgi:hypothetical protein